MRYWNHAKIASGRWIEKLSTQTKWQKGVTRCAVSCHLGILKKICFICINYVYLTHWGRATHICVSKLTIIASDNGLSPGRRQAIIWNNARILSIGLLGTNFSEILVSSANWRPFCLGLHVLKVRTRFRLISINMLYRNEADFLYDTASWDTPFCHFVLAFKSLSFDRSKFCLIPATNYWTHKQSPMDSQSIDGYPGRLLEILSEVSKNDNSCTLFCLSLISDIANCVFRP